MSLKFRNINASPNDPVDTWGSEGILTALERGTLFHWMRIIDAASRNKKVAKELHEALKLSENEIIISWVREKLERKKWQETQRVSHQLKLAVLESGLTQKEFALRLGTSPSRLSTYLSAQVSPRAELLEKAKQLATG
jgi:hypothetical protein